MVFLVSLINGGGGEQEEEEEEEDSGGESGSEHCCCCFSGNRWRLLQLLQWFEEEEVKGEEKVGFPATAIIKLWFSGKLSIFSLKVGKVESVDIKKVTK